MVPNFDLIRMAVLYRYVRVYPFGGLMRLWCPTLMVNGNPPGPCLFVARLVAIGGAGRIKGEFQKKLMRMGVW
jgi:hypothetical protein